MTDFLDLLETVRAEEASIHRLFGDAGTSVRGMRRDDPRYHRSLAEAAELYAGVLSGRTPMHRMQEAMSTSDFPLLFGDILDRQMLGAYAEWPSVWPSVARRATVRDFRTVKRFTMDGAEAVLPEVPQGSEYPEEALTEGKYEYAVKKFGRRVPFLWEAFINDDLDSLRNTPNRLAKAARISEDRFFTDLFTATGGGPDATFFAAGNSNIVTGNPALSVAGLQTAFTVLAAQRDIDGNPILSGNVRLVVPPALEVVANNILNAIQIEIAAGSSSATADQLVAKNWMTNRTTLVVNPYLPVIGVTNPNSWYLFAEQAVGRPALEMGFLRGHESPELFAKAPNALRVGGGPVAVEDGDFDTDGINYKVRHVFGGSLLDPKAAVASTVA